MDCEFDLDNDATSDQNERNFLKHLDLVTIFL